ncbi:MAG: amphi-Trp domain-containing protein [Deltaproteobacteria bacterium]|nr:amphi-Trp domain-containing protein [Deltaproteobacteria bacterium]
MDKPKIELKNTIGRNEVITYLEGLVEGFKAGKIVLEQGDLILEMTVPEVVQVEVEAGQKKDKAKFALELTWYLVSDSDEFDSLKISGQNPGKAVLAAGFDEVGDKEPISAQEPKAEIVPKAGKAAKTYPEATQPEKGIKPPSVSAKESERLLRIGEGPCTP